MCSRCGKCCQKMPCGFAQARYGLHKNNFKSCPSLRQALDGRFLCHWMTEDADFRHIMLDNRCEFTSRATVLESTIYNVAYRAKFKAQGVT